MHVRVLTHLHPSENLANSHLLWRITESKASQRSFEFSLKTFSHSHNGDCFGSLLAIDFITLLWSETCFRSSVSRKQIHALEYCVLRLNNRNFLMRNILLEILTFVQVRILDLHFSAAVISFNTFNSVSECAKKM